MASHDLINTKPTILGATLGAIPGIAANPPARFSFAPSFSERFFENWGGSRAQENQSPTSAGMSQIVPVGPIVYQFVLSCSRSGPHSGSHPQYGWEFPDANPEEVRIPETPLTLGAKKPINRKHINIFLTALEGESSQRRTPTRPRDKRDKMAILL